MLYKYEGKLANLFFLFEYKKNDKNNIIIIAAISDIHIMYRTNSGKNHI